VNCFLGALFGVRERLMLGFGVDARVDNAEGGLDRLLCCSDVKSL
jgi:hypothetical protein